MSQGYKYNQVLIDASRILNSPFSDAVLLVSGAQLELLRNMTQYLNRRSTFVDTYHTNYYQLPSDGDWDEIQAVVADLEYKLMGSDNTLWGYNARLSEREDDTLDYAGSFVQDHIPVPAGEIWIVHSISLWTDTQSVDADCAINLGGFVQPAIFDTVTVPADGNKVVSPLAVVLAEGDKVRVTWWGLANGQRIKSDILGYTMKVPE
jgi:hypothetical protein